jgi:hypothetical protein
MKIPRKSGPSRVLRMESDYIIEDRGYESPCWIWQGDTERNGYGRIYQDGKRHKAHRFMYERFVGPIPERHYLHHKCEQPLCVNPDHLTPKKPGAHLNGHRSPEWYKTIQERRQANPPPHVAEMRKLYESGEYTQVAIGKMFGRSHKYVHEVVHYKVWAGQPTS